VTRWILAAALALTPLAGFAAEKAAEPPKKPEPPKEAKLPPGTYARLKTAKGEIVFRLLADKAPKTVQNFVELAKGERPWKDENGNWVAKPFYNGLTFHRVENGALKLIQGGDPNGDGSGGPGYHFRDEIDDSLNFDKPDVVAMANAGRNTNGSQFFITVSPAPSLNGRYSIFGELVAGLDVARAISEMPSTLRAGVHMAKEPVAIQSVTIEEVKEEAKPKGK